MDRYSIRLHGLGGQGLKSMIQDILAPFLLKAGLHVQAFPFFTGERRGAEVMGYFRCGSEKITTHSFINDPDMVVIFDHERISVAKAIEGLKKGGIILINTTSPKRFLGLTHDWRVYTLDARSISLSRGIGEARDPFLIINSAMAGAVIGLLESVFERRFSDDAIQEVLADVLTQKISENSLAFSDGKNKFSQLMADGSPMWQWLEKRRSVPYLSQPNERCTKCNLCYLFCPKRAIEVMADGRYVIHGEKCNYCGICVESCPREAIHMVTDEGGVRHE